MADNFSAPREAVKFVAGLVVVGGWAAFTLLWLLVAQLASIDPDSGSMLAVTVVPILAVTATAAVLTALIFRPRR